ncbi:type I-B CRISPR-associated protein Cas7/Csh2 [Halovenus salina]|uniref:Type I-B CRISPR-associated protein Cas7/Csh2 n=1 Tax=Halovenus salina TaxID=1510225 RepID=A0ABD5W4R9_9EURY|nr:type I-B CRISPR-associated protein Cas7/Csh2 [Halovenus salina]
MTSTSTTETTAAEDGTDIETRSEILFVYDAQDCNPNGDPYNDNQPRIDQATGQAVVTDVRLKRYLREQLQTDKHGVFIRTPDDDRQAFKRIDAALGMFEEVEEPEDFETVDAVKETFLKRAADVRYFGATFSFDVDNDETQDMIQDRFGSNLTGPVQFSPARSLNRVERNTESKRLTSVLSSDEENQQGTFAQDERLKYAIFPFHGVVNENGAADTHLSTDDVERLDTLLWRSIKNQTISRSKIGQAPRLYLRVEFESGFHTGDLHRTVELGTDDSPGELRDIRDVTIDVTETLRTLNEVKDKIEAVHIVGDRHLTCSVDLAADGLIESEEIDEAEIPEEFTAADLGNQIETAIGIEVNHIDVWEDFKATLPKQAVSEEEAE